MRTPLPITVVIPVRDEARNLAECLPRLARYAEVVVVDSGSTDGSRQVAESAGARWVEFRWDGRFPKKRNWFLRQGSIRTPWVLFLDADELVDDAFGDELERTLPGTPHSAFWLHYDNWFLGRRLRHGEGNRKLALMRVGAGEYERIDEDRWSDLDMEVHEHPVVAGTVGEIVARLEHRDIRGFSQWLRKHDAYSTWEAHRAERLRAGGPAAMASLTARQRRKYASLGAWWLPPLYFARTYMLMRGFLDGYAGFAYAMAKAIYFWQVGVKIRELRAGRA